MTSIIAAFFVSLVVATLLTPLVLKVALARGLYDLPNERKVHARPIPRLGGVAIVLGFFAPVTGLLLVETGLGAGLATSTSQVVGLFVGGLLVALLGLYDDLKGANAYQKFGVQIGVAVLMWGLGYRIDTLSIPFGGTLELGVFSLPLTIFWFVGVMNAVNLIDGLDGLAGGIGLISVATLMVLALMDGNVLGALMCACLAGALVGFLFFNFNPARIFMGDTGSLFLGFVLAAFSISTSSKSSTAIALTVPILALALPIVDTMLAIGRRVVARRPIFSADQEHIHHRLLRAGLSHRGTVLVLYAVAMSFAGFALLVRVASQPIAGLILLAAGLLLFVLLRLLSGWHRVPRGLHDPFGREGLAARAALDAASARIMASSDTPSIRRELDDLARATRCLSLLVFGPGDRLLYVHTREATPHEAMRPLASYEMPLGPPDEGRARLELRFVRSEDDGDLGVVLSWERIRPSLGLSMDKLRWPALQTPVPMSPAFDRPAEPLTVSHPLPPWTRSVPRPGGGLP
jgi:UDP-GlcNAc:undecaprenyl-phosphate GlcNAc-1-phosphate transferase